MDEHEKSHGGIKIIDKRRFRADGDTRQDTDRSDREKPKVSQSAQDAAKKSREQQDKAQPGRSTTDFLSFIASLATNAMAALGAIPQAQARGMPVDHAMAREYIDIIGMLQERTKGNLSPDEDKSMVRLLGELRSAYVQIAQPPPDQPGSAAVGAGIVPGAPRV